MLWWPIVLLFVTAISWVSTAPQGNGEAGQTTTEKPVVSILKQINKINLDGSYTYGFEASDGTFRVETRDNLGNVKGKFGYLDESGQVKVLEYTAGSASGFTAEGHHLPLGPIPSGNPSSIVRLPAALPTGNFDDEFGTDEDFQSVDADEDGIPDPPRPKNNRVPISQSNPRPIQQSIPEVRAPQPLPQPVPQPIPQPVPQLASQPIRQPIQPLPQQFQEPLPIPQLQPIPLQQGPVLQQPVQQLRPAVPIRQDGTQFIVPASTQPLDTRSANVPVQPQLFTFPGFNPGQFRPIQPPPNRQ